MRYKYCPKCGSSGLLPFKGRNYQCPMCMFIFWQNSKPTVTASIIKNKKVLLGKRSIRPYKGYWDLPGGFLQEGEKPEKGLIREVKEEFGVEIEIQSFIGTEMDKYLEGNYTYSVLCLHYKAKIIKGEPKPMEEFKELKWFPLNDLPKRISFKSNKKILSLLK